MTQQEFAAFDAKCEAKGIEPSGDRHVAAVLQEALTPHSTVALDEGHFDGPRLVWADHTTVAEVANRGNIGELAALCKLFTLGLREVEVYGSGIRYARP